MKITFIYCPNGMQKFSAAIAAMSAWLKRAGHETSLIIVENDVPEEDFKRWLKEHDPDVLAFSAMTFQWAYMQILAKWGKDVLPRIPFIIGGYHPTGSPEDCVRCEHFDYVVRGEGEGAMEDLLDAFANDGDTTNIPNVWCRDPKDPSIIHRNELRPLIDNLDILPGWDHQLYPMEELLSKENFQTSFYQGKGHLPIATGRGCPYQCTYCCNSELMEMYNGKGVFVRRRSPEVIISEIETALETYGHLVNLIDFWDEEFEMPRNVLEEFCDLYAERIGLPFALLKTASLGRVEDMAMLREAGATHVLIGVESGNEEYRKKVLNKPIGNEDFIEFFDALHEMGYHTVSTNMINLPGETPDMARETIAFNRRLNPTTLAYFRYQPFEGTRLFDVAKEQGFLREGNDYWYESRTSGLLQPTMREEDLLAVEDEFAELKLAVEGVNYNRVF